MENRRTSRHKMTAAEAREWHDNLPPKQRKRFDRFVGIRALNTLLYELANGDVALFQKKWGRMYPLHDSEFETIQEQLRRVWDPDTPAAIKNRILAEWLQADKKAQVVADWERGQMWVNPTNLFAELVTAMLSRKDHLAVCQNPDCEVRYFIAPKKGRKYCEQGECTAYAQRKYARESWQRKHRSNSQSKIADVA